MKQCSIVWVGFKSGIKWLKGDFNCPESTKQDPKLDALQDEFEKTCFDTANYAHLAAKYLRSHDYEVMFNDYLPRVDESMSEQEANEFVKKLRKEMSVSFKFKKVNGDIRKAKGTLNKKVLPKQKSIDKARKARRIPDSIIIYWDLDKEMFRCFRKSLFISYL